MNQEIIKQIREWIKENALRQTSYDPFCWDDRVIMFKRTDTEPKGYWSQEHWDELLKEFEEEYISYPEFLKFLDEFEKKENDIRRIIKETLG